MILVIILALIAHLGYALNDFTGALGARKFDSKLMSLLSWLTGTAIYLLIMPFFWQNSLSFWPVVVAVLSGMLAAVSYPLFLYALKYGNAALVGVVAGTFPLWIVIISLIIFKETLTATQVLVIGVIIIGIILSSLHLTRRTKFHNLLNKYTALAFLVSIMWGIAFSVLKYPVEEIGWFNVSFITSLAGSITSFIWLFPKLKTQVVPVFKKYYKFPLLNAITGVGSTMAYNYAISRANSSIVAPIAGSYGGLFALLSYFVFREKLTRVQVLGICVIVAGVASLSITLARS